MNDYGKESPLYSVDELHVCEDATRLIDSHQNLVEHYAPRMNKRELCDDFTAGIHWTPEEEVVAEEKGKTLITLNYLKPSERTFVGSVLQQRYDIKPAPIQPQKQDKSDIYTAMYHHTADTSRIKYYDPNIIRSTWSGGSAWQESYMEITTGRKPRIIVKNQNNYAIYPDPNRRDLVTNSDCEFIDRVSWLSLNQLISKFPDKEGELSDSLQRNNEDSDYTQTKIHADRTHEYEHYRNGKYKVIERFYRVRKKKWFGINQENAERVDVGYDMQFNDRESFKQDYPYYKLDAEDEEFLYLAIAVPSMNGEFLYNDEYHCQPKDPATGNIMFPLYELIDEELNGESSGHVESQIGVLRLVNSIMVNKLHQAKMAAGQSHVVSRDHFDENEAEDVAQNHADGNRTFIKKKGAPSGSGVDLIEQGRASVDSNDLINFANTYRSEVSSTPPSMQGLSEGNIPGILNEQRIQQSSIQSQVFVNNYMCFLINRAKLWKYYWKKYWKHEDVIRVLEPKDKNSPEWVNINQIIEDEFGNIQRESTFDDADYYDITFEDSWKSPTVRDKVRQQISQLLGNVSVQQDQVLSTFLTKSLLDLSDAPQDIKDQVEKHSQIIQQSKQQAEGMANQTQELDQLEQTQRIAQNEAQAELPPLGLGSQILEAATQ